VPHAVQLPGIFHSLAPTLNHYGYLAVAGFIFLEDFGTPFIPGETILIAAAIYAGAGRLNVVLVGVLAVAAATLGDNVGYAIGRFAGHEAIARWGRYVLLTQERIRRAEAFFNRHGGKIVTVARFVDGLRQVNGIVAGLSEMPWPSFALFNALGAVLWVGCWLTVGYVVGDHIVAIYNWFSRFAFVALIALGVFVVVFAIRHLVRRRRRDGQPRPTEPGSPA
jgi:membrane protein DedA with SNARE-associated domain